MEIFIYIIMYMAVAGASVFGLLVGAYKFTDYDLDFPVGWVLCGIFWPVALLPAIGYIAAGWYLNRNESESK